jgi:hypothetical protein
MKDTPHAASFTVKRTDTHSYRYHGEAEKRSHRKSRFTDSTGDWLYQPADNKRVLNPVASYSKTITLHWFHKVCVTMHWLYVGAYQCASNPSFLRHVEMTLLSKFFILPRLIMDIVMLASVLLLKYSLIIMWRWRHKFLPKYRYLAAVLQGVALWLRRCATSRKVPGSIPGRVTGDFFRGHVPGVNSASRNEYQDIPGGKGGRCVGLTTLPP